MSGKKEQDPGKPQSGKSVLRKAKSFRDDLKSRIVQRTPSLNRISSSPRRRRKTLTRGSSFNEPLPNTKAEFDDEVDHLQQKTRKVFQSLKYLQDVVDKGIPDMLPGSTTIVLETIMEVHQLLGNYFDTADSAALLSMYNQTNLSLANLIRWADNVLLHGSDCIEKEQAHIVIRDVNEGIRDLLSLSVDKLTKRKATSQTLPRNMSSGSRPPSLVSHRSQIKQCSSDVPLTPRELKILEDTKRLSNLPDFSGEINGNGSHTGIHSITSLDSRRCLSDNSPPPIPSRHSTSSCSTSMEADCSSPVFISPSQSPLMNKPIIPEPNFPTSSACIQRSPPPKPYHPGLEYQRIRSNKGSSTGQPPPLPEKQRVTSSNYSFFMPSPQLYQRSSHNEFFAAGRKSPIFDFKMDKLSNSGGGSTNCSTVNQSPASSLSSLISGSEDDQVFIKDAASESLSKKTSTQSTNVSTARSSCYDNIEENYINLDAKNLYSCNASNLNKSLERDIDTKGAPELQCSPVISRSSIVLRNSQDAEKLSSNDENIESKMTDSSSASKKPTELKILVSNCDSRTSDPSPPPLPSKKKNRIASQYDNIETVTVTNHQIRLSSVPPPVNTAMRRQHDDQVFVRSKSIGSTLSHASTENRLSDSDFPTAGNSEGPPPLPPKKKHVETYLEMLGDYSSPPSHPQIRHSIQTIDRYERTWFEHQIEIYQPNAFPIRSVTTSRLSDISTGSLMSSNLQKAQQRYSDAMSQVSGSSSDDGIKMSMPVSTEKLQDLPPTIPPKERKSLPSISPSLRSPRPRLPSPLTDQTPTNEDSGLDTQSHSSANSMHSDFEGLDDIDVSDQLLWKNPGEDGPDVRAGSVNALIVHATTAKDGDFMYQEAFLTTYRTFISPAQLVEKLLYRYNCFSKITNIHKKKLSRSTFSLLVRVVDDLSTEVDEDTIQLLMHLEFQLVCEGELMLAKILRLILMEKCEKHKQLMLASNNVVLLPSYQLTTKQSELTDFRSQHIAEQMTLLDWQLFHKIEISEVLLYKKEHSEEFDSWPNLTRFTEHFNKMSYWCRTLILDQEDARDRERYMMKFIKIMKHLRRMNNFNSYLATLSAVSSAPIKRLKWENQNAEALKEYSELIDFSQSFRAYRQALSEAEPPCIPYIGVILQDLRFVREGNPAMIDNRVNFAMRWLQFTILENMRCFKSSNYEFKKIPKIITFFDNFDNYKDEDVLWQISQSIKPSMASKKSH